MYRFRVTSGVPTELSLIGRVVTLSRMQNWRSRARCSAPVIVLASRSRSGHYALVAAFPTRAEALDNLRNAWWVAKRPWFLALVAIEALLLVVCAASHNVLATKGVAVVGLAVLLTTLRGVANRRR